MGCDIRAHFDSSPIRLPRTQCRFPKRLSLLGLALWALWLLCTPLNVAMRLRSMNCGQVRPFHICIHARLFLLVLLCGYAFSHGYRILPSCPSPLHGGPRVIFKYTEAVSLWVQFGSPGEPHAQNSLCHFRPFTRSPHVCLWSTFSLSL